MMIEYLRSFRIFNIALFDLIMTYVISYFLLKWLRPGKAESFYISWLMVGVLPLSVLAHLIFQIPTTLNYYLGVSSRPI
jgi:hypothetical protein